MPSITGFGGIFLRPDHPKALYQWYERHLGLVKAESGYFSFPVPTQHPEVVFSVFKRDDAYFPPAQKAMINLQVDDLDGVLDRLTNEGVTVDPKRESYDFGKFGWISDPEGNRVELWQPVAND
ncbi:MAG TPA: VOC family protein [Terracidiphilus sp.]|jgi:predicted enzyme related to lactoylglutathione lyase